MNVEVSNLAYYDVLDGVASQHPAMFTNYKWDIAPISTLVSIKQ
jgi:hypothetical protein